MAKPTKAEIDQLFAVHLSKEAKSERLLRSYGLDDTRQWVDPNGHRLSDRIWDARRDTRKQIDDVLRKALASGEDALLTARKLEQFLDPSLSPVRTVNGRLVRNQAKSIVTTAPGRGGMGSFSSRRLARTEITRAHGQSTLFTADRTPFATGVKWNLSGRHPRPDECDANASRDVGLGRGVYPTKDVPRYPSHPQDLCSLSIVTEEDDDKIVADLRKQYGLDEGVQTPVSEVGWSPSMTSEQAETWSSESAMREPLFHGTSQEGIESIPLEGFDLSRKSNGKFFGNGAYLSESSSIAQTYAESAGGDVLTMRVNVHNVVHVKNEINGADVIGSLAESSPNGKRLLEIRAEIEAESKQLMETANYKKFFNLSPEQEEARDLLDSSRFMDPNAAAINQFVKEEGIDAFRIANGGERDIDIWVIFDPKNVTVVMG